MKALACYYRALYNYSCKFPNKFLRSVKHMYTNVYIWCIYIFNLCSGLKFNKWSKENIFMMNHSDMKQGMLRILNYLPNGQYQLTHLYFVTCPAAKPQYQVILKALIGSKQANRIFYAMSCSDDTCCPLSLWCLQCSWWAFCRVYNFLGLSIASCHSGDI